MTATHLKVGVDEEVGRFGIVAWGVDLICPSVCARKDNNIQCSYTLSIVYLHCTHGQHTCTATL